MDQTEETGGDEHRCDVVVVGSGAGGMAAALTAAHAGLSVIVIEKGDHFGGSSALSGGAVWIPRNPVLERAGVEDTFEEADAYLEAIVGDRVPSARRRAFLERGPEAIRFLEESSRHIRYAYSPGYSDYHPEAPGGSARGRSMSPVAIDAKRLGVHRDELNRSDLLAAPGGIWLKPLEYRDLLLLTRTWRGRLTAARVGLRTAIARGLRRAMVSTGQAGMVRMRLALRDAGVPLWLDTALEELVRDETGAVVGISGHRAGRPVVIRASRGVILAAGGFERNAAMREQYQRQPITATWTSGAKTNTGDGIRAGLAVGAAVDQMDRAWWGPAVLDGDVGMFILAERSLPGSIMVDGDGRRFTNESAPYVNVVDDMYAGLTAGQATVPCFLILDQTFRDRYPFAKVPPRRRLPDGWVDRGVVHVEHSIDDLAHKIGVDPHGLAETVERFNEMARAGRDLDHGRGESAYDRYYSDPTVSPNPNLAPLVKPPFYAFTLVPGDLGTSGGLVTDEEARVLRADGSIIEGLYATGNCSASVMGHEYAGPGATIGPAITFGYVAARHLAGSA